MRPDPFRMKRFSCSRNVSKHLARLGIVIGVLSISTAAAALGFTPGGICSDAGFEKGHAFRQDCVDRVFQERRSRAWREQAPAALAGMVGAIAASGGAAFGFVSVPGQTNLRRVDVAGQSFFVHVPNDAVATVVSTVQYKNIPKEEIEIWLRAASQGAGCTVSRYVRDFDALYVWTDCAKKATPGLIPDLVLSPAKASLGTKPSIVDDLERLAGMYAKGTLSASEFEAAKADLLAVSGVRVR